VNRDTAVPILYQYPGGDGVGSVSPPCFKIELALRLLGADYERVNVTSPGKVRQISSTGRLPVLEVDGARIHDSIRILNELEGRFEAPWLDATERERLQDRLWEYFVNEHLYWCGFYLRWVDPEDSARFFDALFGKMKLPARWLVRRMFLPRQRRRSRLHGSGGRERSEILDEIVNALEMLVTALDGGPFLQGRSAPGRGDLAVASLLGQAGFRGSLPEVCRQVKSRPPLMTHLHDVFAACEVETPRWLGRD
jgi:glutathione S-transferase